jgi:hypothetical protein
MVGRVGQSELPFQMAILVAIAALGVALFERLLAFPLPVLTVCAGHAYPMEHSACCRPTCAFALRAPGGSG